MPNEFDSVYDLNILRSYLKDYEDDVTYCDDTIKSYYEGIKSHRLMKKDAQQRIGQIQRQIRRLEKRNV